MQIEIVNVGKPYKDGKWGKLEIEYIRDGKNSKRTLTAIGGPQTQVINQLRSAESGEFYEVTLEKTEKNGQTYYNWVGIEKVEQVSEQKKTSYQARSTFETPEERAQKQIYIARQNGLNVAATIFGVGAKVEDVIGAATRFADFTLGLETPVVEAEKPKKAAASAKKEVAKGDLGDDDIPWEE